MKKLLLFLFMCLSSFLIYDNVHAEEFTIDENVITYFHENYSDYIYDYWTIGQANGYYFMYISASENMVIRKDNVQMTSKGGNINIRLIKLNVSDMSEASNSVYSVNTNAAYSLIWIKYGTDYADYFFYSSYDLYDNSGNLILEKNYPIEVEPEPTPTPDTPALPGDEGGVSAYDVIKVYMKYFLMGLPVALIMLSIEKMVEIFHNFILGKMRK